MIKFVDIETGNTFDGNSPYVFWFENEQSINLNYVKTICFITDSSTATIKLDSEVFSLIDITKLTNPSVINYKEFYDLEKLTHNNTTKITELTLTGISYGSVYIYSAYILGQGKYVGTITDSFTINDIQFNIGADFYDENEALGINLSNFGFDSVQDIQRAIYENNINEQKPDYILLNRKYKELLNEYISIIANKGSYKSLLNSVKWFEYGELVKVLEYWRYNEIDRQMLSKKDIEQFVTPTVNNMLKDFQKTTYVGLYCALKNYYKENGSIKYIDYRYFAGDPLLSEPIPEIKNISTLWNREEMSIKMVLLGNFFSTYFMPIHLDLIHSTIEDVVFANTIKLTAGGLIERYDMIDELGVIKCDIDDTYHLKTVECFVNLDTVLGLKSEPQYYYNYYDTHSGALPSEIIDTMRFVDDNQHFYGTETDTTWQNINSRIHAFYRFKGIGTIIPFDCILEGVTTGKTIEKAKVIITPKYSNQGQTIIESYNVVHTPATGKTYVEEKFNLLLKEVDEYKIQLEFERTDGYKYTKVFDIIVDADTHETLGLYKLVKRYEYQRLITDLDWKWVNTDSYTTPLDLSNFPEYMMNPVLDNSKNIYRQFIARSKNGVQANQVIVIKNPSKIASNLPILLKTTRNGSIVNIYIDPYENIARLETSTGDIMQEFIVFSIDRWNKAIFDNNPEEGQPYAKQVGTINMKYIVLINKYFTDSDDFIRTELNSLQYKSGTITKTTTDGIYTSDEFIPYFWKLEPLSIGTTKESYTVSKDEIVCFLPENCTFNKPSDFMWRFENQSTDEVIEPTTWRNQTSTDGYDATRDRSSFSYPTILQPLLGRYDFANNITPGYYDISFRYTFGPEESKKTKEVKSYFLIE